MRASQNQNQARLSGGHGFLSKTKPRSRRLLQLTSGCGFLYMGEAYDRPLFSGREDRTKEGKKDEKEGKTTIPCTQKFVRIYLLSVRCWKPPDNWDGFWRVVSKTLHGMNKTAFPLGPNPLGPASLISYQPDLAEVSVCLRLSQELSFMDFPSSKGFCSTAGQIRPQHAWLRTAAAHPRQLQPAGAKARSHETGSHSQTLRSMCLAG